MNQLKVAVAHEIEVLQHIEPVLADRYFSCEPQLWQLWPLLRIQLGFENFWAARPTASPPPANGLLGGLRRRAAAMIDMARCARELAIDRQHNSRPARADVFFSTYSTSRYCRNVHGEYVDAFVTPLREWMTAASPCLAIDVEEIPTGGEFRVPRDHASRYTGLRHRFIELRAHLRRERVSGRIAEFLADARMLVRDAGGVCQCLDERRFGLTLALYREYEASYLATFQNRQPRLVFVVTYYSLHGMAMMAVAKQLGITTVDVQHGVQGAQHFAYGQWPAPPVGGYRLLPDVFWCWSRSDVENVESWAGGAHAAIDGGNVWTQYVEENPGLFPGDQELRATIAASGRTAVVLVTLSPGAAQFVRQLRDAMQSPLTQHVFWLLRLHPAMLSEEAAVREAVRPFAPFCELSSASRVALPLLLRFVDLHVTEFSSVILEAEESGVRSLSVIPDLAYFAEQQAAGSLLVRRSSESIAEAMCRCLPRRAPVRRQPAEDGSSRGREALRSLLVTAGAAV